MLNGSSALLHREVLPKGWPKVQVRELTAGELLDLYQSTPEGGDRNQAIQMRMVVMCVEDENGQPVFSSVEEVRALPARMVGGLLEIVRVMTELNVPDMPVAADDHPTLPPTG